MNQLEAIETTIFNVPEDMVHEVNGLLSNLPGRSLDFIYAIGAIGQKYALPEYYGNVDGRFMTNPSNYVDPEGDHNSIFGRIMHRFDLFNQLVGHYSDQDIKAWKITFGVNIESIAFVFHKKYNKGRPFSAQAKEAEFVNHALAFPGFAKAFLSLTFNTVVFGISFWRHVSSIINKSESFLRTTRFAPNYIMALAEIHAYNPDLLPPELQNNAFIIRYIQEHNMKQQPLRNIF